MASEKAEGPAADRTPRAATTTNQATIRIAQSADAALEAERFALGAAIELPEAADALVERLTPADLYSRDARAVFEAIREARHTGSVDAFTVRRALAAAGHADPAMPLYVADLIVQVPMPTNFAAYIEAVREGAVRRRVADEASSLAQAASNGHALADLRPYLDRIAAAYDRPSGELALVPLDIEALRASGLPQIRYLDDEVRVPEASHVRADGPAGSAKSVWAAWLAARLSRQDLGVNYYSQENPLAEDVRRLERLRPEWPYLRWFHPERSTPIDLADPVHVRAVIDRAGEDHAVLVVFDTETACWSGDENDNAAIAALDRDAVRPITRETGAAVLMLGHTGNPIAFTPRKGVNAARGASSKGQKCDSALVFTPDGQNRFRLEHAKARMGGATAPPATFEVIDTDDGALDIVQVKGSAEVKAEELADAMVEVVAPSGFLTTSQLRAAVKGGRDAQSAAFELLAAEDPPRLVARPEVVETENGGRQRAKVWRPAQEVADGLPLD